MISLVSVLNCSSVGQLLLIGISRIGILDIALAEAALEPDVMILD